MRSRAQGEVPLQPRPQRDIQQGTNINNKEAKYKVAARGYTEFKVKEGDMKERGASGYADFRKTPGAGGNAVVHSNKHKMKEKAPEAMPFFGKPQEQPEAMQISNAKNGTGRKHEPEAMPIFEKPKHSRRLCRFSTKKKVK